MGISGKAIDPPFRSVGFDQDIGRAGYRQNGKQDEALINAGGIPGQMPDTRERGFLTPARGSASVNLAQDIIPIPSAAKPDMVWIAHQCRPNRIEPERR
ncbi:MAG: hypothetical protein K2Q10_10225, partial [Rhodospirillales bacterium]|nr:hypothetical protein [Rhodospirillales bacterium]